jgi:hypothetical protein
MTNAIRIVHKVLMNESPATSTHGRPDGIEARLAVYCSVLACAEMSSSRSNLMRMAFWDEAFSPLLGCRVDSVGFLPSLDKLPFSTAVDDVLQAWADCGKLVRKPEVTGDVGSALFANSEIHALADEHLGAPWTRLLMAYLDALRADASRPRVSFADDSADLGRLMQVDLGFVRSNWREADGPAAVSADMGGMDPRLRGRFGNPVATCVAYWMECLPDEVRKPHTIFEAIGLYGMLLTKRAAEEFPEFGDGVFHANRAALSVMERSAMADGVETVRVTFLDGAEEVAWMSYATTSPGMEEPELGTLLDLRVAESRRHGGVGTLAVRHAIAKDCLYASPPNFDSARLLGSHGTKRADGGYTLLRVRWPTCDPADPPPVLETSSNAPDSHESRSEFSASR